MTEAQIRAIIERVLEPIKAGVADLERRIAELREAMR